MKYKTKLNIGEKLYAFKDNYIQEYTIEQIDISIMQSARTDIDFFTVEKYTLRVGESSGYRASCELCEIGKKYFTSPNVLIKSLQARYNREKNN